MESIAGLLIILLTQAVTGWMVARTHHAAPVPMVVVFAAWLTLWFFIDMASDAKRLLLDSLDQPGFRTQFAWYLTPIAVEIFGLLCGGILGSPKRRQPAAN